MSALPATVIGLLRATQEVLDSDDTAVDEVLAQWVGGLTREESAEVIYELLVLVIGTAEAGGIDLAATLERAGLDAAR